MFSKIRDLYIVFFFPFPWIEVFFLSFPSRVSEFVLFCFALLIAHCSVLLDFVLLVFGLFGLFGHFPLRASCACILPFCFVLVLWFVPGFPNSQLFMFFSILPFSFPMVQIRSIQRLLCTFFFFPPEFTLCSIHFPFFFLAFVGFCASILCGGMGVIEFHCLSPSCPALSLRFRVSFSQSHWLFNTDKWK